MWCLSLPISAGFPVLLDETQSLSLLPWHIFFLFHSVPWGPLHLPLTHKPNLHLTVLTFSKTYTCAFCSAPQTSDTPSISTHTDTSSSFKPKSPFPFQCIQIWWLLVCWEQCVPRWLNTLCLLKHIACLHSAPLPFFFPVVSSLQHMTVKTAAETVMKKDTRYWKQLNFKYFPCNSK